MAGQITGGKGLTVEVANLDRILMAFGTLADKIADAAQVAALEEAKVVFVKTQHRVPWFRGELYRSGRVEETENEEGERTAAIAYGGPAGAGRNTTDVDYALIVHERLDTVHLFGRSAKYVEGPVREELESGRSAARMGASIRQRMGWE